MVDALHKETTEQWTMPTNCLHKAYENTTESSALRRMLMWTISRSVKSNLFEEKFATRWPREALLDVLRLVLDDRLTPLLSRDQYTKVNMCRIYHVHEDGASRAHKADT